MKVKAGRCGTDCGVRKRAVMVARAGAVITYRWPCGYEKTETLMVGPRGRKRPACEQEAAFMSRVWRDGVIYQCPKCQRAWRKSGV